MGCLTEVSPVEFVLLGVGWIRDWLAQIETLNI